jgi:hypothetical protein
MKQNYKMLRRKLKKKLQEQQLQSDGSVQSIIRDLNILNSIEQFAQQFSKQNIL